MQYSSLILEIVLLHILCIAGFSDVCFVKLETNAFDWNVCGLQIFRFVFFSFQFSATGSEVRQYRFLSLCQSKRHRLKIFYLRNVIHTINWNITRFGTQKAYPPRVNVKGFKNSWRSYESRISVVCFLLVPAQ